MPSRAHQELDSLIAEITSSTSDDTAAFHDAMVE